jgi:hypothetical protein
MELTFRVEEITPQGSRDARGSFPFMAQEQMEYIHRLEQGLDCSDLPSMDTAKLDVFAVGVITWKLLAEEWSEGTRNCVSLAELYEPGFVMPETLKFISGMIETADKRWNLEEAIMQCQLVSLLVCDRQVEY